MKRSVNAGILGRARVRRLLEWSIPPRLRLHVFRFAAFVLPSQVGPQGFLRLASELGTAGHTREAMLCWRILHEMAPTDTNIVMQRVSCALDGGDLAEAERALEDSADGAGIPPQSLVRLAGQLAQHGHMRSVGRMLVRLTGRPDAGRLSVQSPSILSTGLPDDIGAFGAALASEDRDSTTRLLLLARLCFTFRNPGIAATLFGRVSSMESLCLLDRVAMLHAQAEADPAALHVSSANLRELVGQSSGNPDALGMLAKVAVVAGEKEVAHEAVRLSLDAHYSDSNDMHAIKEDCSAILHVLAGLRDENSALPPMLLERVEVSQPGVPKVFLCGFGWSGSGALYDEVRGVPGYCEFEGAGLDAIINEDAESEVTFVQGPGGLGDLWQGALQSGRVSWDALWNTLNLHVAGLSSIGYAQYKSSAAARNHVRRYGSLYTRPFRRFLESYAQLRRQPRPGALHACLLEATESLCSMIVEHSGRRAVLFNNAVFGRDAAMLEIFRSRRAAIVYRDPCDVYVDRRDKDLNHWRTPAQLAAFYAYGLHRYTVYRQGRGEKDPGLREVPFERFVEDEDFRAQVRAWLLGDLADVPAIRHFDPAVSRRNIGIHLGAIAQAEQVQLRAAREDCRALDQLSEAAWRAEA